MIAVVIVDDDDVEKVDEVDVVQVKEFRYLLEFFLFQPTSNWIVSTFAFYYYFVITYTFYSISFQRVINFEIIICWLQSDTTLFIFKLLFFLYF